MILSEKPRIFKKPGFSCGRLAACSSDRSKFSNDACAVRKRLSETVPSSANPSRKTICFARSALFCFGNGQLPANVDDVAFAVFDVSVNAPVARCRHQAAADNSRASRTPLGNRSTSACHLETACSRWCDHEYCESPAQTGLPRK